MYTIEQKNIKLNMGQDRFVCFGKEIPTVQQIRWILEDYLGEFQGLLIDYANDEEKTWDKQSCWFVSLPGKPSFPFKRVVPELAQYEEGMQTERWFEVYIGSLNQSNDEGMGPNIDVITRMQDELTDSIATRFAEIVARYFKAKLER